MNKDFIKVIYDKAHDENLYTEEMKKEYTEEIAEIIEKLNITDKDSDIVKIDKINNYLIITQLLYFA